MNEQHITLDISKTSSAPHVIRLGQGDRSGTTIVAEIYDNGAAFSLTGKSARFLMRLPSGNNYVRDSGCTVSGNTVRYVVDEEHCCAVAGYTEVAYFEILVGTSVIASTQRFCIEVLRSALDGATTGEVYDTEVEAAIRRAIEAAEAAEEAAGGTIPLMNSTTRGGAKLGYGLNVGSDEKLGVVAITNSEVDSIVNSVFSG